MSEKTPRNGSAIPSKKNCCGHLLATGKSVLIDQGAEGEESERVRRLCERVPGIRSWKGAYAPFAYAIARANQYVGYDSAGQHVAAACGTPLLSIFAGYATERMFQRWRPDGPGKIDILKVVDRRPAASAGCCASVLNFVIVFPNRCSVRRAHHVNPRRYRSVDFHKSASVRHAAAG